MEQGRIRLTYYLRYQNVWCAMAKGRYMLCNPWKNAIFAAGREKTRLVQGFHASYAEAKAIITAKPIQHAFNAKEPENQAIRCHVPAVKVSGLIKPNTCQAMVNIRNSIAKSLLKRQEALSSFKARKQAFQLAKEQILKDIEEARTIWQKTLEQLPNLPFGWQASASAMQDSSCYE